ncbi:MAG: T9SS type A sorting domain-containing protein [Bacteroidales bacterium]|nr:T9SS type A sorting domain-containing protein [Bacteroidales bacterium]MCF8456066.1 T9SS type A sorting domain-containing protein [Bacteroidales bacterium]
MMKRHTSIIFFFIMLSQVYGQSLTPWVLGSTGGFFSDSLQSISWTVGEVVTKTFSNNNSFLTQGFQQPLESMVADTQYIQLDSAWSMFSTYLIPQSASVPAVMAEIEQDVSLVKDGGGFIYWPMFGANTIGNLKIGEGYQVKMLHDRVLVVVGTPVVPEEVIIYVPQTWSIIGYLRQEPAPLETMLSSIYGSIVLLKDSKGQVYWPVFNLNMIGDLEPGQGYQLNSNSVTALIYPPNNQNYSKSTLQIPACTHFSKVCNSESNLTLGIPYYAWDLSPEAGDEIAVYSNSGILVGSSVFNNQMHSMPVWGDDPYSEKLEGLREGEPFYLTVWHKEYGSEEKLWIEEWQEGSGLYKANDICIASRIKHSGVQIYAERELICKNYPNPFNEHTKFEFSIPQPSMVRIEIFSLLGESVEVIFERQCDAGPHEFDYNNSGLVSGTYIYKVWAANQTLTQNMSIMK